MTRSKHSLLFVSLVTLISSTSVSAELSVSSPYIINGPYAEINKVTDGNIISYNVAYTGSTDGGSGDIIGYYSILKDDNTCFTSASTGAIYYTDLSGTTSLELDCNVIRLYYPIIQKSSSTLIASGSNLGWGGSLNNNNVGGYTIYTGDNGELYVWSGDVSTFVASGTSAFWQGSLNDNNVGSYSIWNGGNRKLYVWSGGVSTLVASGSDLGWVSLNNNNVGGYTIYTGGNSELYVWSGGSSTLVASGTNVYWGGSLNNNNVGGYTIYTGGNSELYVWSGGSSTLVASGSAFWQGSLNNNNVGGYIISTGGNRELYIWSEDVSTFVASGSDLGWVSSLNNNNVGNYYIENESSKYELYVWSDGVSTFVDVGYDDSWVSSLNNNNVGNYYIENDDGSLELYVWQKKETIGNIRFELTTNTGVSTSPIPSVIMTGNYGTHLSGTSTNIVDTLDVYHVPVVPTRSSRGKDTCPSGDYSPSYSDGSCGIAPVTGEVLTTGNITTGEVLMTGELPVLEIATYTPAELFNPQIPDGYCYTREGTTSVVTSQSLPVTDEFQKSLLFMYSYNMTMYKNIEEFDPYADLTREQAAKILSNFATNVLCREPDSTLHNNYTDLTDSNPTLTPYIHTAYQLGLMQGKDGIFRPRDIITKAELNAVIVRMILASYLPENTSKNRYDNYNTVATKIGIITQGASQTPVIRNDSALMLFRAYKNQDLTLQGENKKSYILDNRDEFVKYKK